MTTGCVHGSTLPPSERASTMAVTPVERVMLPLKSKDRRAEPSDSVSDPSSRPRLLGTLK